MVVAGWIPNIITRNGVIRDPVMPTPKSRKRVEQIDRADNVLPTLLRSGVRARVASDDFVQQKSRVLKRREGLSAWRGQRITVSDRTAPHDRLCCRSPTSARVGGGSERT